MSAEGVVWEAPSTTRSTRFDWQPVADALRERPGEWALIRIFDVVTTAYQTASSINAGRINSFPKGEFEATARSDHGHGKVYARFIGGGGA